MRLSRSILGLGAALLAGTQVSCAVRPPPPPASVDGLARTSLVDGRWPGLEEPAQIAWDTHAVPSVRAGSEADAAYALGLVHAHLRLSQMEFFRRAAWGRLAESGGPFLAQVDKAVRAIDLTRAVPEMERRLPAPTRRFIERFVEGVNDYRARHARSGLPADARTLGFTFREPWTVRDVLAVGRLASLDLSWALWLSLVPLRREQGHADYIARVEAYAAQGIPSFGPGTPTALAPIDLMGRTGSNAVVVAGTRSASGGALVASDPHLGLLQPSFWLAVGYHTPQTSVVGLSIPGVPFVVVGRNRRIAWTGTNMQSSSSELFRLPEGWERAGLERERISVRWWFGTTLERRESPWGPVISDAPLLDLEPGRELALRWRGHEPSDEATPFLLASRAGDWPSFREGFSSFAVAGQNILYADAAGRIGQLMAIEAVPGAASAALRAPIDAGEHNRARPVGVPASALPSVVDPPEGFLVSANNVPTLQGEPVAPQGNANDRVQRLGDLLRGRRGLTLDDLAPMQQDVYSIASHRAARELVRRFTPAPPHAAALLREIERWDGRYEAGSVGASAYQSLLSALIDRLYERRYGPGIRRSLRTAPYVHDFVREDLASAPPGAPEAALADAAARWHPEPWGERHRLVLQHPIGAVPLLGRSYVFQDLPWPGSTTTVMKAVHPVSAGAARTVFGANARILFDMGTADDNRFVILGGQDGWMGSDRLLDQAPLFAEGRSIPLPLSWDAQRARAARIGGLEPGGGR